MKKTNDDLRAELRAWSANVGAVTTSLRLKAARERDKWACPACSSTDALSLTRGPDRTLRCKCFSCDFGGDIFNLVAATEGLDVRQDFPAVLKRTAELAGIAHATAGDADHERLADPGYPSPDAVRAMWDAHVSPFPTSSEGEYLRGRGFDVDAIATRDLLRVAPEAPPAYAWARYGSRSWAEAGYRMVVPVWDATGAMRSLRAWCTQQPFEAAPKRIAPKGFTVRGLVMADVVGVAMLRGEKAPTRLVIAEGEPDFLAVASQSVQGNFETAVLGIEAGAWTELLAARVPDGCTVAIWTHEDKPGDRYAEEVRASLASRCTVLRGRVSRSIAA